MNEQQWRRFAVVAALAIAGCQPKTAGDGGPSHGGARPRACTEMTCSDAAVITASLSSAGASLGSHTFTLEIDGRAERCSVEFTSDTQTAWGTCSGSATVSLGPAMQGKETSMDGVVGYTEEPIPGQFQWQLTVQGTPSKVGVVHTSGGQTILEQTATLTYVDHHPNGEGCEPVCKSASATWQGP